jgi:uncharacterized protein YbbC (DUF1343 family)
MPSADTALVYPGGCLLEGTTLSEGRGTTRPFEIVGGPKVLNREFASHLNAMDLPGVRFIPWEFEPTFQKHAREVCGGVFLLVTDRMEFRSVFTTCVMLSELRRLWPDSFGWKEPPYEYETEKLPIDILAGGSQLRGAVDRCEGPDFWNDFTKVERNDLEKYWNISRSEVS